MWVITEDIAQLILRQFYEVGRVYNPVNIDGVWLVSEVEKNALVDAKICEPEPLVVESPFD